MSEDLCFLTIAEAADLIRTRELSPVELVDAHLARIAAIDPQLNAFITVTAELAREQARQAQRELAAGRHRGPLHGIPFGLKDLFNTRGILTTAHSKVLIHNVPNEDAAAVTKLYDAGAVLLGKLATHEFAHGGPSFDLPWPPARNPWNTAHFTGGSSTGSAAAVAAGLAATALGTDTGGSVRSPAFLCGTVGLKPTFGLVSRSGIVPFSASCDHVGPLTRTVEDSAIVLQALAGFDPRDSGSAQAPVPDYRKNLGGDLRGTRIGVIRHFWEEDSPPSEELRRALEAAIGVLRQLGASVEDIRLRSLHDYYAVRITLTENELFAIHLKHLRERPGDYGHHFLGRALAGCLFTSADYIAAQRERRRMIDEMQPVYAKYDVVLTSGAGPAPRLDAHKSIGGSLKWSNPSLGTLFSVTGAPALALPCGFSSQGLPLGMQIAGRPFDDATVLRVAHAYERAAGWHKRHPQLVAGAAPAPIEIEDTHAPVTADIDDDTRALAAMCARRAGLKLNDEQFELLCRAAPYALAMSQRIRRDQRWTDEQASVFTLRA